MSDMRRKVFSGLVWTYAERFWAQIISLLVTIVLARLLTPDEYGIIAIITVFMTIADSFAINGLGNALIQKKNVDDLDYSSVFFFNILFSLVLYGCIFGLAHPISVFYNNPLLKPTLRVMAIRVPIAAINSVQHAYVSKTMQFKKFFYATSIGTVISGIVGIVMAYLGLGVWALVAQYMSNTCIDTIVLWFTVEWRPKWMFSWSRTKELFSYGWKVLATSMLMTIYSNIQDLIIGKKYSSADLAYCNKGRQFPSLISTNVNTSITKVLFPMMAEYQDDLTVVKQLTRKAVSLGAYVLIPLLIGLAAVGDEMITFLLTEKWLPCVIYLRIMCLVYALQPMQMTSIQTIKALGRSDLYLKLEIYKRVIGVVILLITVFCFNSVEIIIWGMLGSEISSMLINMPTLRKLVGYSFREQIADFVPPILLSAVMYVAVYSIHFLHTNIVLKLVIQVLVGIASYVLLSWLTKNKVFISFLKKRKKPT